ncbi:MAG TPA: sensor domain-containing diguanylate cyclase [Kofleriaceae bacterium]|jgi:diguanylate cyclase (GGDEF)-like protein|nr:sensor domain-containing diguanylate cyclase [Kofleriaceae bacterium]
MNTEELQKLPAALFEIGKLIGSELDPGILLARIAELICQLVDAKACSVMLLDVDRKRLLARAAYGLRTEQMNSLSFRVGEGVAGWVVEHGEPALIHDVTQDPRFVALPASETSIASMICVPLIARGERVGVVTVTNSTPRSFDTNNLELVRFIATTIALDIENVRLHRVAVTDPLTGAYNREFLMQRLPQEIEIAADRDRALSVAMVDVDHFKTVNDHYGHGVGDAVLSEVARRLRGAIRAGDLLVRYGGEEFLTVLPKADAGRAWEVGERMRQRVCERAFEAGDGIALLLRVSVGIAQWRTGEMMSSLFERADAALYTAKDRGRNRVEVAP